jgi:guanyl-specific ribonuclease Sa
MVVGVVGLTWLGTDFVWNRSATPSAASNQPAVPSLSPRPAHPVGALPAESQPTYVRIGTDPSGCPYAYPSDLVTLSPREICPSDLGPGWTVGIVHVLACGDSPQTAIDRPSLFVYRRGRFSVVDEVTAINGTAQALALVRRMDQQATSCPGGLVGHFDAQHGLLTVRLTVAGTPFMIWVQATPTAVVEVSVSTTRAPAPSEEDVQRIALIAVRKAEALPPSPSGTSRSAGASSTPGPVNSWDPAPQLVARISYAPPS